MFDFLGTFNRSQFNRLAAFARDQLPLIDARIAWLNMEIIRVGSLVMAKDPKGNPTGYAAGNPDAYIGKLTSAYEILGGNPFYDLQVRQMSESIYLLKGDEVSAPKFFSSGDPVPEGSLADAPSANLVSELKSWLETTIDRKEYLERKIRRAIDYVDQLQAEISTLERIRGAAEASGSLENIISQVGTLISDKSYRAVADDKGRDKFGKYTKARYSAYEPGPGRGEPEGEGVERTNEGYYLYGEDPGSSSESG